MNLAPVIGLETHIQLKTKTKLFCACSNDARQSGPNAHICPVCLGHPGVLPVPNRQAVEWSVLLGLALNGSISGYSKFDRKHYFYPDLPKAYQISQFDLPIMEDGHVVLDVPGEGEVRIDIERLHLEEDAAKNLHGDDGSTYVDFNRGGTPLCEIVTKPVIKSSAQAKAYMQYLRLLARTLEVSDGDMEKGNLRCDVNISLREVDDEGNPLSDELHAKTEIKNVNSFKAVERAIAYEIKRQTELWEAGKAPGVNTTRRWIDAKQKTEQSRSKEDAADYRYFPEPDIPPMKLEVMRDEIQARMPELPLAKKHRFVEEYGFRPSDAGALIDDAAVAGFTENAMSELGAWLQSSPDIDAEAMPEMRKKLVKLYAGWVLNKLAGVLAERKILFGEMKVTAENFAEFILMIARGEVTGTKGLEILGEMVDTGGDPSQIVESMGAKRIDDEGALGEVIDGIIADNPGEVERFKGGEAKLMQFFIGQVMKATTGNADPGAAAKILKQKLG